MRKSTELGISALCLFTSVIMVACQGKNTTSETKTLSYQYEENGCNTGKKEFSTIEAYCATLADDSANNYCAPNFRQQDFEHQCNKHLKPQSQESAEEKRASPAADLESNKTSFSSGQITQRGARQTLEVLTTERVVLTANANRSLAVKTTASGEEMITTLEGELPVTRVSADIPGTLNLVMAESTFKPDISSCKLSIKNFNSVSGNETITFTLMSIEKKSDGLSTCIKKLNQFAIEGFTAEFENVRVGGPLSQKLIKKLIIEVRP